MSLDSASSQAFSNIFNATDVRSEFLIPVLSYESGLDPSVPNRAGAPYYGISQNSGEYITAMTGLSVDEYLQQPASFQLNRVVLPYFKGIVDKYGPLRSGIQVYQAVFYPASLGYALGLDDIIVARPSAAYNANAGFDKTNKGYITPRDLGAAIASQVPHQAVQQAIAAAYAFNPGMGLIQDPIYGDAGWSVNWRKAGWAALGVGAGAYAAWIAMELYGVPRWAPKWVKRIT